MCLPCRRQDEGRGGEVFELRSELKVKPRRTSAGRFKLIFYTAARSVNEETKPLGIVDPTTDNDPPAGLLGKCLRLLSWTQHARGQRPRCYPLASRLRGLAAAQLERSGRAKKLRREENTDMLGAETVLAVGSGI